MKITELDIERKEADCASDFSEMMQGYEYGLFYYLSEVKLMDLKNNTILHLDQLLEARLFSEDKELHIFENEVGWQAVLIRVTGRVEYIEEWCPMSS